MTILDKRFFDCFITVQDDHPTSSEVDGEDVSVSTGQPSQRFPYIYPQKGQGTDDGQGEWSRGEVVGGAW